MRIPSHSKTSYLPLTQRPKKSASLEFLGATEDFIWYEVFGGVRIEQGIHQMGGETGSSVMQSRVDPPIALCVCIQSPASVYLYHILVPHVCYNQTHPPRVLAQRLERIIERRITWQPHRSTHLIHDSGSSQPGIPRVFRSLQVTYSSK